FLVSFSFIVAASGNLHVILLYIYWMRFINTGAIIGMLTGLITSIILVAIGPYIMNPLYGWFQKEPIINLFIPGIILIPLVFISAIIGSLLTKDNAKFDYDAFYLKAQTGIVEKKEVFR